MNNLSLYHLWEKLLSKPKRCLFNNLLMTAMVLLPIQALADSGVEVTGQGDVIVKPDQFSLTLTVTERGRVPSKLKALIDKKSNSVISAARSFSVKDSNISSARVNLRIIEEKPSIQVQGVELKNGVQGSVFIDGQELHQQINQTKTPMKPLFELSRQITVSFDKIDKYDAFLAQIIKINVNHISPLLMSVKERDEYYQQALLQAIDHAKEKAQRMAKQAGSSLGDLVFVKEVSNNHYRPMYAEAMMSNPGGNSHVSQVGSQIISARVLVKFHLEN